jgi:RNA polymerase sigma factor (sigma-70 family)
MDDEYIRRVCNGDGEAFRYFVSKYKDMAFSIAISVVKDQFQAEEVVQDAFLSAYNGLGSFRKNARFSTWFYRIVVNQALRKLKKIKREIVSFDGGSGSDNEAAEESWALSLKEEEQDYFINRALERLPPKESLALRLFYLQEESIREICQITGWSESNAKVILFRARNHMLIALKELRNSEH